MKKAADGTVDGLLLKPGIAYSAGAEVPPAASPI